MQFNFTLHLLSVFSDATFIAAFLQLSCPLSGRYYMPLFYVLYMTGRQSSRVNLVVMHLYCATFFFFFQQCCTVLHAIGFVILVTTSWISSLLYAVIVVAASWMIFRLFDCPVRVADLESAVYEGCAICGKVFGSCWRKLGAHISDLGSSFQAQLTRLLGHWPQLFTHIAARDFCYLWDLFGKMSSAVCWHFCLCM